MIWKSRINSLNFPEVLKYGILIATSGKEKKKMKVQSLSAHSPTSGKKTCFPSELGFLHEDIRPPMQKN
jgi:hypothetical protein